MHHQTCFDGSGIWGTLCALWQAWTRVARRTGLASLWISIANASRFLGLFWTLWKVKAALALASGKPSTVRPKVLKNVLRPWSIFGPPLVRHGMRNIEWIRSSRYDSDRRSLSCCCGSLDILGLGLSGKTGRGCSYRKPFPRAPFLFAKNPKAACGSVASRLWILCKIFL